MDNKSVIVSACLLGLNTRYNGGDAMNDEVIRLVKDRFIIPVCPEQLGGLPTPRPRSEIAKGSAGDILEGRAMVIDESGKDVTGPFMKGAHEVLKLARLTGASEALLKEKSPSCGVNLIYRDNKVIKGSGVTTALLKKEGIYVKGF